MSCASWGLLARSLASKSASTLITLMVPPFPNDFVSAVLVINDQWYFNTADIFRVNVNSNALRRPAYLFPIFPPCKISTIFKFLIWHWGCECYRSKSWVWLPLPVWACTAITPMKTISSNSSEIFFELPSADSMFCYRHCWGTLLTTHFLNQIHREETSDLQFLLSLYLIVLVVALSCLASSEKSRRIFLWKCTNSLVLRIPTKFKG